VKKFFKIVFGLIIFIIVAVIAAVLIIPQVVDPNDYRDEIAKVVEDNTGRKLEIGGKLELNFFPWLGINLNHVVLYNDPTFEDNRFVNIDKAQLQLKVMPLFEKQVEVDIVRLDGVSLYLSRDAEGHTNWEDLQNRGAETEEKSDEKQTSEMPLPTIKGLELKNTEIVWDDKMTGDFYVLSNLNLETGVLKLGEPLKIQLNTDVESKGTKKLTGHIEMDSTINPDVDNQHYQVNLSQLVVTAQGDMIPNKKQMISLSTAVDADMKQQKVTVDNFKLTADNNQLEFPKLNMNLASGDLSIDQLILQALGITVNANIQGKQILTSPTIQASIATSEFNPQAVLKTLGQTLPSNLPTALTKARLKTSVSATPDLITLKNLDLAVDDNALKSETITFNPKKGTLSLDLALNALGLALNGKVNASDLTTKPSFSGNLKSSTFNLRELLTRLGQTAPALSDPTTLTKVTLNTELQGSASSFGFKNMNLQLDDSRLNGDFKVENFEKPALDFALNVDKIDLDRYMPPKTERKENREERRETNEPLPTEQLRDLNINGSLKVDHLSVNKLTIKNANLKISAKQGKISISSKNTQLYKGSFSGNVNLDAQKTNPLLSIVGNLEGVQAQPLLTDLMGKSKVDGTANLKLKLTANATTPKTIEETVTGAIDFAFLNGALDGFNLGYTLRQAKALLKRQPAPPPEPLKTDFTELKGALKVNNGVFQTDNVNLQSPAFRVNGKGKLTLATKSVDFDVNAAVVETTKGQGGKALADLKGYSIPVKIQGKLDDLQVRPDLEAWLAGEVKAKAEAKLEEKKQELLEKHQDKIDEKLGEEAGKVIKDLNLGDFLKRK